MSVDVALRIVGTADDRQIEALEKRLKSLGSAVTDALKPDTLVKARDAVTAVGDAAIVAGHKAETSKGMFDGWLGGLAKIGLAGAGVGTILDIGRAAVDMSKDLLVGSQEVERYNTQLGTLLGSSDAAKERMAELADFGVKTPFELPQLVEAEKVMIGFGLTTGKSMELASMSANDMRTVIGDVAAGTGKDFAEIALTFGKFSAGATGEAISRLQEMGVVTREELQGVGVEFSKSGQLTSPLPVAFEAATKLAKEKFGGGMDALSNTFEGKMSTLSDTWAQIKRSLAAPIFDVAKAGLDAVLPMLSDFATKASEVSAAFESGGLTAAADKLLELSGIDLTGVVGGLTDFMAGFQGSDAPDLIGRIADGLKAIGGDDTPAIFVSIANALPAVQTGFQQLLDVGGKVVSWLLEHKELVAAVVAGLGAFSIVSTVVGWIGGLVAMFGTASAAVTTAGGVLGAIVALLGGPVTVAIGAVAALVGVFFIAWQNNFGGIQEKTAAVFAAVGAWFDKAKRWFDELVARFQKGDWGGIANQVIGMLAGGLRSAGGLISQAFHTLVDKGVEVIRNTDWGGLAHQALDMLVNLWKSEAHLVGQVFGFIIGLVIKVIRDTDWGKLAHNVLDALGKGAKTAGRLFVDAIVAVGKMAWDALTKTDWGKVARDILNGLGSAFRGLASVLVDIGKSIIDGIIAGIMSAMPGANQAMAAGVNSLHSSAAEAAGAHSPARKFIPLGRDLMLGIELGIAYGGKSAEEQMRQAIAGVSATAQHDVDVMGAKLRERMAQTFRGGGAFENIFRLMTSDQFNDQDTMTVGHLDPSHLPKPPDWRLLAGDPDAAKKAWDKYWDDLSAQEDKRAQMTQDALTRLGHKWANNPEWTEVIDHWFDVEKNRHKAITEAIAKERGDEAKLWQDRADAIAAYQEAMQRAQDAIAKAQAAAEKREGLIHDAVLAHIEEQRTALEAAHSAALAGYESLKKSEEERHKVALAALAEERQRWEDYLAGQEDAVKALGDQGKELSVQLGRLKLDLGLDEEKKKLDALQDRVSDFQSALGKLDVIDPDAKKAAAEARKKALEKIALTTDEQKRMLESVKSTLSGADLRTAELLLQGHALKAQTVRDLMSRIAAQLQVQADKQKGIIDGKQAQIDALQRQIDLNKQLTDEASLAFEKEKERVQVILDAIAARETAENARSQKELERIAGLVAAETRSYETARQHLDALASAEDKRHTDRLRQIAEEYALELARLGHTQEEIDALVAAAAEEARRIAAEAAELFKGLETGASVASVAVGNLNSQLLVMHGTMQLLVTDMSALALSADTFTTTLADGWDKATTSAGRYLDLVIDMGKKLGDTGEKETRNPNFTGKRGTGAFRFSAWPPAGGGVPPGLPGDDPRFHVGGGPNMPNPWRYNSIPSMPNAAPTTVNVNEGTVEHVNLGGVNVELNVNIDGKKVAREVVDAAVKDVTILDQLGRALRDRQASQGSRGPS